MTVGCVASPSKQVLEKQRNVLGTPAYTVCECTYIELRPKVQLEYTINSMQLDIVPISQVGSAWMTGNLLYINGSVRHGSNSSALAMELLLPYTKPSICTRVGNV